VIVGHAAQQIVGRGRREREVIADLNRAAASTQPLGVFYF